MGNKKDIVSSLTMVISIIIMILAAIQLIGVWENAIYVFEPLMGITCLLQCYKYWHVDKSISIINLVAGIFILFVAIFIIFFR